MSTMLDRTIHGNKIQSFAVPKTIEAKMIVKVKNDACRYFTDKWLNYLVKQNYFFNVTSILNKS